MSRCIRKYNCSNNGEMIMSQINTYLIAQGYTYKNYDGEMVYHKGNGWFSNPKCFKIQRLDDCITIEGWMKWSLLPFVAVGEIDYSQHSFVGAVPRKVMQKEAAGIERIIEQYTYANAQSSNGWSAQWRDMSANEKTSKKDVESSSGNMARMFDREVDSTEQTVGCSHRVVDSTEQTMGVDRTLPKTNTNPTDRVITKKEYIKSYADEPMIKDIKKAAIAGYVCTGITAVLGFAMASVTMIVEALIITGLLLGMHLGRKKWCAITYLVISILDCIISLAVTGKPSGWLLIISGIWAVVTFRKLEKAYQIFKNNGYANLEKTDIAEWNF